MIREDLFSAYGAIGMLARANSLPSWCLFGFVRIILVHFCTQWHFFCSFTSVQFSLNLLSHSSPYWILFLLWWSCNSNGANTTMLLYRFSSIKKDKYVMWIFLSLSCCTYILTFTSRKINTMHMHNPLIKRMYMQHIMHTKEGSLYISSCLNITTSCSLYNQ